MNFQNTTDLTFIVEKRVSFKWLLIKCLTVFYVFCFTFIMFKKSLCFYVPSWFFTINYLIDDRPRNSLASLHLEVIDVDSTKWINKVYKLITNTAALFYV